MDEKEEIVRALHEGITAAWNVLQFDDDDLDPFTGGRALAYAALASLESEGFKVVRKA